MKAKHFHEEDNHIESFSIFFAYSQHLSQNLFESDASLLAHLNLLSSESACMTVAPPNE